MDIYKNSVIIVIVDNMKEDCFVLEKQWKLKRSSTCCVRCVPSDLKRTDKYGSLNGT